MSFPPLQLPVLRRSIKYKEIHNTVQNQQINVFACDFISALFCRFEHGRYVARVDTWVCNSTPRQDPTSATHTSAVSKETPTSTLTIYSLSYLPLGGLQYNKVVEVNLKHMCSSISLNRRGCVLQVNPCINYFLLFKSR